MGGAGPLPLGWIQGSDGGRERDRRERGKDHLPAFPCTCPLRGWGRRGEREWSPSLGSTLAGILTGRCVNYSAELRTCEIQGWCPTEVDTVER